MIEVYVLHSNSLDVYHNLAFETALLNYAEQGGSEGKDIAVLFLWRNDKTVVIGRHQNPYKECNLSYMLSNSVKLARRISGGGAVYHDLGNLNFSFICSTSIYNLRHNLEIITETFKHLGIPVYVSGRNDILLEGKKISGNAYKHGRNASLHHGTILIDVSSNQVSSCLKPNSYKLSKRGVNSVSSRIINLKSVYDFVNSDIISDFLAKTFVRHFSKSGEFLSFIPLETAKLYDKYVSREWIYSDFNDRDWFVEGNFPWGSVGIDLSLDMGAITDIKISTDSLEVELFELIERALKGSIFTEFGLHSAFSDFHDDCASDVENLLLSKLRELCVQ